MESMCGISRTYCLSQVQQNAKTSSVDPSKTFVAVYMALNLVASQHDMIRDMIVSKSLKTNQMADVAGCSPRSVKAIRSNL
jgi:hypothetical protein